MGRNILILVIILCLVFSNTGLGHQRCKIFTKTNALRPASEAISNKVFSFSEADGLVRDIIFIRKRLFYIFAPQHLDILACFTNKNDYAKLFESTNKKMTEHFQRLQQLFDVELQECDIWINLEATGRSVQALREGDAYLNNRDEEIQELTTKAEKAKRAGNIMAEVSARLALSIMGCKNQAFHFTRANEILEALEKMYNTAKTPDMFMAKAYAALSWYRVGGTVYWRRLQNLLNKTNGHLFGVALDKAPDSQYVFINNVLRRFIDTLHKKATGGFIEVQRERNQRLEKMAVDAQAANNIFTELEVRTILLFSLVKPRVQSERLTYLIEQLESAQNKTNLTESSLATSIIRTATFSPAGSSAKTACKLPTLDIITNTIINSSA